MSSVFSKLLEGRLKVIEESIKAVNDDSQLKGSSAELHLKKLISEFSPHFTRTIRGWVFDENEKRSGERDILIYNKNNAPEFLFDETSGLIPVEAAIYDIQIKSSIRNKEIPAAIKAASHPFLTAKRRALIGIKSSNGDLLNSLLKNDIHFLQNPVFNICLAGGAGYFLHRREEIELSKIFSEDALRRAIKSQLNVELSEKTPFDKITVNQHNLRDLLNRNLVVYCWDGHLGGTFSRCMQSFLVGFTNSVYEKKFGKYLSPDEHPEFSTFTCTICTPEGEAVFEKIDLAKGFDYSALIRNLNFKMNINEENKIDFFITEKSN